MLVFLRIIPKGGKLVKAGKNAGYTMLLGSLPGNTPAARAHKAVSLAKEYASRGVAGVIMEPVELMPDSADLTREIISAFDDHNIPVVLVDREISTDARTNYDLVGMDNFKAGFLLGRHLIANGARHIVFLMPPHSASTNIRRMLGLAGAAIEAGLDWSRDNIVYTAIAALLERIRHPDAPPRKILLEPCLVPPGRKPGLA